MPVFTYGFQRHFNLFCEWQPDVSNFKIRTAENSDLEGILNLANDKRLEYETRQPVFWRVAPDAIAQQRDFITSQIEDDKIITLVASSENKLIGFAIGRLIPSPPVYNPGGPTCLVDDFVVNDGSLWETVGADLLDEVRKTAISKGAVQVVVVCGHFDEPKRRALENSSLTIASEWWVAPLDTESH